MPSRVFRVIGNQSRIRRIVQAVRGPSALTLGTSIAAQALTVVSGVLAARALGVEGRGALAVLWLIPVTLVLLGGIGIPQATTFYVAREAGNARKVVAISGRLTLGLALFLGLVYSAGLLLYPDVGHSFSIEQGFLSVGLVPMFLAQNLATASLLGMKRYRAFNFGRICPVALYAAGVLGLFVSGHASLSWILIAMLFSWTFSALLTWAIVLRDLPASEEPVDATARGIASFGLRGVIGSVSPIDDVRADQLLVGALMDTRALGLYVAAIAFCNFPRFIAQSIGSIAFPRIASARSVEEAWTIVGRALRIGVLAIVVCAGLLFLALPYVLPLMFGDDFSEAVGIGRVLLVAAVFLSVHRLLTELARGLGHPGYGSITELVNLTVFLLGIAVFAAPASTDGIALAVLAGGVASSTLLAFLIRRLRIRHDPLPKGQEDPPSGIE